MVPATSATTKSRKRGRGYYRDDDYEEYNNRPPLRLVMRDMSGKNFVVIKYNAQLVGTTQSILGTTQS